MAEKTGITAWEAMKVIGGVLESFGTKAEDFENETGGKYTPTKEDALTLGVELLTKLGIEIMD